MSCAGCRRSSSPEQARKQSQQDHAKHVYTEEDLKHAHILTPEDRAQPKQDEISSRPRHAKPKEELDVQSLPRRRHSSRTLRSAQAPLWRCGSRLPETERIAETSAARTVHLPFAGPSSLRPSLALPCHPRRNHAAQCATFFENAVNANSKNAFAPFNG